MNSHTKVHGKHGDFAIEAKGLVKRFKSGKSFVEVLKGVDFDARHGDLTMVMGPSGSGKSTLIAALSGLLRPEKGRVDALDVDDLWSFSSGRSSPDSAAISVDLPEPDGPMTMVRSPCRASKFTPFRTST